MQSKHIKDLAYLHFTCLGKSFLSKLGINFLEILYKAMLPVKSGFTYVYEKDNQVVGFITGCYDANTFFKDIMRERMIDLIKATMIAIYKRPLFVKLVIGAIVYPNRFEEKIYPKAELLSIAVDEKYRGNKIGEKMLQELISKYKESGVLEFKVGVKKEMQSANNFYIKNGFKFINTVKVLNDDMNYYKYKINEK